MIISVTQLKALYTEFSSYNDNVLANKLEAIELSMRAYTHNNFQNKALRSIVGVSGNTLTYKSGNWLWLSGDTIQVSDKKGLNNGLCTISATTVDNLTIDKTLYAEDEAIITKVVYPKDIVEGCIQVLRWDVFERDGHEGIASETISRHSVSYVNYDAKNTINGYPSKLFGFCTPYMRILT